MIQRANNIIENDISHIQIHSKEFREDYSIELDIPNAGSIETEINANEFVKAKSSRVVSMMMIGTSKGNGRWTDALFKELEISIH